MRKWSKAVVGHYGAFRGNIADIMRQVSLLDERKTKAEAGSIGGRKQSSCEPCLKEVTAAITARKAGTSATKVIVGDPCFISGLYLVHGFSLIAKFH